MNGVILTTHGSFASGLYSTIQMIAGDFENIRIVEFKEGHTLESVDQRIIEAYENLADCTNILVLTDLAGGTPFNRAVMALGEIDKVRILSGVNFAMVYQALASDEDDLDSYEEEVINISKESILSYKQKAQAEDDDDDFSDGI